MDRGAWQATVHRVAKRRIRLRDWTTTTKSHSWELERGYENQGSKSLKYLNCADTSWYWLSQGHEMPNDFYSFFLRANILVYLRFFSPIPNRIFFLGGGVEFFYCFVFIFIFFYFTILYWFCHISTCIHHGCTRVHHAKWFLFSFV